MAWRDLLLEPLSAGVLTAGEVIELHQARQQSESFLRGQFRAILIVMKILSLIFRPMSPVTSL